MKVKITGHTQIMEVLSFSQEEIATEGNFFKGDPKMTPVLLVWNKDDKKILSIPYYDIEEIHK